MIVIGNSLEFDSYSICSNVPKPLNLPIKRLNVTIPMPQANSSWIEWENIKWSSESYIIGHKYILGSLEIVIIVYHLCPLKIKYQFYLYKNLHIFLNQLGSHNKDHWITIQHMLLHENIFKQKKTKFDFKCYNCSWHILQNTGNSSRYLKNQDKNDLHDNSSLFFVVQYVRLILQTWECWRRQK
jgi:hypothetical protein